MSSKNIREFLIERGQDPEDFARLNMDEDTVRDWGFFDTRITTHVMDIKRFGDLMVKLCRDIYLSGYPGIRRVTSVVVYSDNKKSGYSADDVYIDGGCETHHLDRYDRDFDEILGAEWSGSKILVRVKSTSTKSVLQCEPFRHERVSAVIMEPNTTNFGLEVIKDITKDEVASIVQQLRQKYANRKHLVIKVNGYPVPNKP